MFTQAYAHNILAEFTQSLRRVYTEFTQSLRTDYARFTHSLRKVYARFTQSLRTVYTDYAEFTQGLRRFNSQANRTKKRKESFLAMQHGGFVNAKTWPEHGGTRPGIVLPTPDHLVHVGI